MTTRGNCSVRRLQDLTSYLWTLTRNKSQLHHEGSPEKVKTVLWSYRLLHMLYLEVHLIHWYAAAKYLCNMFVCLFCADVRSWALRESARMVWSVSGRPWRCSSTMASPTLTSGTGLSPSSVWRRRRSSTTATQNIRETHYAFSPLPLKMWPRFVFSRRIDDHGTTIQGWTDFTRKCQFTHEPVLHRCFDADWSHCEKNCLDWPVLGVGGLWVKETFFVWACECVSVTFFALQLEKAAYFFKLLLF